MCGYVLRQDGKFPRAKDMLDRYESISPKLQVDYVDPDKKPQAARAAGIRNYGATSSMPVSGAKKRSR